MKRIVFFLCLVFIAATAFPAKRVLYIGDSITDGGWGRSGGSAKPSNERNHGDLNHIYGQGYVMLCAAYYQAEQPDGRWQFWNRGISGNTLPQMANRWDDDAFRLHPDVISILIGTNDVGEYEANAKKNGMALTLEGFDFQGWETKYRHLLDTTRQALPDVKMVLCTPFVGKSRGAIRCAITDSLAMLVRRMAIDYQAVLVPFDSLFTALQKDEPTAKYWIWDGIHPTSAGHLRMAQLWQQKVDAVDLLAIHENSRVTMPMSREQIEWMPQGPYQANWQSIAEHYRVPEWFKDAKFGIFIHWGVYSVPATGSEWYPKHMYNGLADVHRQKFGSQARFGYKDFIPLFHAEHFNPQEWASLFRESGAKYVIPTAEHHDGFAMYDSKLTTWNAKNMGPKRDVIGELARAVRNEGMKFGVSNHRVENWDFMYPEKLPKDSTDLFLPEYAGLYGPPQKPTRQSGMGPSGNDEGHHPQSDDFMNEWLLRVEEIIDSYHPDLLYFDNGINYRSMDPWKLRVAQYYYNRAYQWGQEVSIQSKSQAYLAGSIQDFERESRAPRQIYDRYWQVDDPIGHKFGYVENLRLQNADGIIRNLVDNVSCNGNLCLNISPKADGTIPEDQQQILRRIGQWLRKYGNAIYSTRAYVVHGEGKHIRFTQSKDGCTIYVLVKGWNGEPLTISSLKGISGIKRVKCLADGKRAKFKMTEQGLSINKHLQVSDPVVAFEVSIIMQKTQKFN